MQIIHIIPQVKTAGGTTVLKDILLNLPNHIKSQIWANTIEEDIYFNNAKLIHTNHANIRYFPKILKSLKLEKRNNTLIHIHGRNGFFIFLAAKLLRFRVIYHPHGYYFKLVKIRKLNLLNNFIDNLLLKFSDLIIFCSNSEKNYAKQNYLVNPIHRTLFNRTDNLKKIDERDKKKKNKKNIIYCLATNNIHQKGIDKQLQLIKELTKFTKNFKLIHFFNFANLKELDFIKQRINSLGLKNYYFLKNTKEGVWDEIYKKNGIILSTSRFEGLPMVLIEAFHNFIPVVATNCYGQEDLLEDSNSTILYESQKEKWAEVLFNYLQNPEQKELKILKAKEYILKFGDMKSYCYELFQCYKFVLGL